MSGDHVGMERRRATSALLAWLAGLALLLGGLLTYSGHVVSDSGQFATRATSTLRDPSMRAVISRGLSSALLKAEPDLVGVQALVKGGADGIVGSAPFQGLVEGALYDVHRTVFVRDADTFTVRLANIGVLADAALRRFAPAVASRLPPSTSVVLASVRAGEFGRLSDVARTLNSARRAGWWLLIGGLVGLVLSVVLAVDRVAGVRRCGLVVACAGLLLAVIYTAARPLALSQFASGDARTAAGVVWNAYLADLRSWGLLAACAGAFVAVSAHAFRRRGARPVDTAPRPRLRRPAVSAPPVRVMMVLGVAVLVGIAGLATASGIRGTPRLAHPIVACNGYAALCDRPVNKVAFAATHNSMGSSTEPGWLFPTADSSCRPNRGGTGKPLFVLNNWVDTSPSPRPSNAKVVNAYGTLLARARRCEAERHQLPNLIAVDFYKLGDVLRVTAALNGV